MPFDSILAINTCHLVAMQNDTHTENIITRITGIMHSGKTVLHKYDPFCIL